MTTLLVVDDDTDSLNVLEMLLSLEGYRVVRARDGAAALAELAREAPDLVVAYWTVPGVDGLELCRRVRGSAATAHVPIILCSAARTHDAEARSAYDALLPKPLDYDLLLAAIRRLLPRR
jgi:DNA-binding response OmpR family regulator